MILVLRNVLYCPLQRKIFFNCSTIMVEDDVDTTRALQKFGSDETHIHYYGDLYTTRKKWVIIYRGGKNG